MSEKNLLKLQNGSDVRGVAVEGIEGESVNLTPDAVNRIGQAFANWLSGRSGKPVTELKIGVGQPESLPMTVDLYPLPPCL